MPEEIVTPPEENNEITLESVDTLDADNLTDDQRTFLEENKGELTPEQAEKFGITQDDDKDDEEDDKDEDFEPETRGGKPAVKSSKKEDTTDDEEDDVDPEDEKTIGKVVSKKLGPVAEALR